MKIVHISMADFNGAGLCAYRICKAQREMGIDSQMVVLNKRHHDDFIHQCGKKRYFYHSVLRKTKKLLRLKDDVNTCRRLGARYHAVYTLPVSSIDLSYERLLREADLLHIHWVGGYLDYPTFFEAFKDKPIVFTLHDENALYGIANIEQQLLADNPLEKKYYRMKYDSLHKVKRLGVVFLSRMAYDLYGHHEMVADRPTTIIHNSVDTRFYEPHDRSEARRRLGLAPETPVFALCACNINEPRKGLEVLSQTLRRISPDCRVLAIGNNRSRPRRHWDNVVETGPASGPEELSWRLSAADYFCLPSAKENFAQAPIEAMACGLPVVAFPCSGTEELITPANGIRCSDFTSEALEDGLRRAMATRYDPTVIRSDATARFSPKIICRQYLDFYKRVMA